MATPLRGAIQARKTDNMHIPSDSNRQMRNARHDDRSGQHVKIVMKRLLIWLIIFLIPSTCFAHSGRTNKDGCHQNRKTGEYHCHGEKRATPPQGSPSNTYDRQQFGNWIDADGDCQNTRHEVLIEESRIPVTFKTSRQCVVISGEWHDPYTGTAVHQSITARRGSRRPA